MGENQRHDLGQAGDAAQKENERRGQGATVCYGKGTVEESTGGGKEGAISRFDGRAFARRPRLLYESLDEWAYFCRCHFGLVVVGDFEPDFRRCDSPNFRPIQRAGPARMLR